MLSTFQSVMATHMMQAMTFLGANGANTKQKGQAIVNSIIVVFAGVGGLYLIAVAIKGIVVALKGDNKDWNKAGIELAVGIVGGVFVAIATATAWHTFFQNMGDDFNVVK